MGKRFQQISYIPFLRQHVGFHRSTEKCCRDCSANAVGTVLNNVLKNVLKNVPAREGREGRGKNKGQERQ